MTGADIVTEARKFLGVRWSHQGRSERGIDCAGLVIVVAHRLGLTDFDTRDYAPQAKDESMLQACRAHLVPVDTPQAGDVAVMRFGTNRHIGILADYPGGGLSLIHAFAKMRRCVIEHRFSTDWLKGHDAALLAVFRFPGVNA